MTPINNIFVICLEREKKRYAAMKEQLSKLGLTAVFGGVDNQSLPEDILSRYNKAAALERFGRPLTTPELGCYASHLQIWQTVCEQGLEAALVLEGDAGLPEDFVQTLLDIKQSSAPWDIVKLYWSECLPSFWGQQRVNSRYRLVKSAKKSYGTVAYLIRQDGAKKLYKLSKEICFPVDVFLSGGRIKKSLSCYSIYPCLVSHQDEGRIDSLIESSRRSIDTEVRTNPSTRRPTLERQIRHFLHKIAPPPDL